MNLGAGAAHLVHMPSHIYLRVGDYEAAAQSNEAALALHPDEQTSSLHARHCLTFLVAAYSMQGRFGAASAATAQLESLINPALRKRAGAGPVVSASVLLLVRFRRWDDIRKSPEPHRGLLITNTFWRWARAMAYAWTGKPAEAETERALFIKQVNNVPADALIGLNSAREVLQIADYVLGARIAHAKGDRKAALDTLRKAVESEDALAYSEPPDWCMPAKETLGGLLLLYGDYVEAEKTFRADLRRNPRNGRSLFGLAKSLEGQGKNHAASLVRREFERAWGVADTQLKVEEL